MTARAFAPLVIAALGAHLLDAIILKLALLWRVRGRYRAWQVWLAVLCLTVPAMAVSVLNVLTIRGG